MRLLIVTQAVDRADPVLGFFHRWIEELSSRAETVTVIALRVGEHELPSNVTVHSLGKESKPAHAFIYAYRFLTLAWRLRNSYDTVFVHMNQEYVLLAGLMWKVLKKRVYLWRNHYAGSFLTDIAARLSTAVFCTSKHSYTARYPHTVLMPVGVDTERFREGKKAESNSVLWLARVSPAKRLKLFVHAIEILRARGVVFVARVVGSPLPKDEEYYHALRARAAPIEFLPAVRPEEAPALFAAHEFFVNTSASGMFDKTLFEAAASGAIPLAVSDDWGALVGDPRLSFPADAQVLADRLEALLATSSKERKALARAVRANTVEAHSLSALMNRLEEEMGKGYHTKHDVH